jgi:hypothetical protein
MTSRAVILTIILVVAGIHLLSAQSGLRDHYIPNPPPDPEYFQRGFLEAGVHLQIAPLDAPTQSLIDDPGSIQDAGVKGIAAAGWNLNEASPFLIVVEFHAAGKTRDDADVLKITVTATEIAGGGKDQDDLWYPLLSMKTIRIGRTGESILETTVEQMAHRVATSLLKQCLRTASLNRNFEFHAIEDINRLD